MKISGSRQEDAKAFSIAALPTAQQNIEASGKGHSRFFPK